MIGQLAQWCLSPRNNQCLSPLPFSQGESRNNSFSILQDSFQQNHVELPFITNSQDCTFATNLNRLRNLAADRTGQQKSQDQRSKVRDGTSRSEGVIWCMAADTLQKKKIQINRQNTPFFCPSQLYYMVSDTIPIRLQPKMREQHFIPYAMCHMFTNIRIPDKNVTKNSPKYIKNKSNGPRSCIVGVYLEDQYWGP